MTSADLHSTTHLRAAAWVPDDVEDRPYEHRDRPGPPIGSGNAARTRTSRRSW